MTHPDPHSRFQYSHHYRPSHHQAVSTHYRREASPVQRRASSSLEHHRPSRPRQQRVAPENLFAEPTQYPNAPYRQPPPRKVRKWRPRTRGNMLIAGAGGGVLALAALAVVPKSGPQAGPVSDVCQQRVEEQSVLSRAELSQLLSVPERSSKEAVQQVIAAPYCTLEPTSLREGAVAQREAYPLEFDPQTWLVVLYEEGEYAGYDFSFKRE
ncbi:MAG: hypothetical protein AAFQ89_18175 [Cyanobacteria bacterium J06626_18]